MSHTVTQGMFQLRDSMCQYLKWELNVDPVTLKEFEEIVRKDSRALAHTRLTSSHRQRSRAALCDPLPLHLWCQSLALALK